MVSSASAGVGGEAIEWRDRAGARPRSPPREPLLKLSCRPPPPRDLDLVLSALLRCRAGRDEDLSGLGSWKPRDLDLCLK